ncbi:MAG: TetR/AcrR family transcriptional regulator [Xanthomonadales bacterium]|nr:TetR/AcrR family transcriptional regulator [Xanthomonadales bacterium]
MSTANATATRGRPKSTAKKAQIFEAAVNLFLEKGFDGTSMDEIAERAEVSKQTVYSHFRSKEDLFSYCIAEKCVSYELSPEFLDLERPVDQMLRVVGRKFTDLLHSDDAIHMKRLLCASAEQSPVLSELYYEAGPKHMIDLLTDYLRRQAERGRLKLDDPRTAACQLLHMFLGETHLLRLLNLRQTVDQEAVNDYVDACVDMFLRAYR